MLNNKFTSPYTGSYHLKGELNIGDDYSKTCIVFPAQSSAFPGMFKEEYENIEVIKRYVNLGDGICKKLGVTPISAYITSPEKINKEKEIIVKNLCLYTLEFALFKYLVKKGIRPELVTGHSFGEYAAITACGYYSFPEMFRIVYEREKSCPEPHELGSFIVVEASEKKVKGILKKDYYVSVKNTKSQTVISVSPGSDIEETVDTFKKKGIRATYLKNMPQPYHSPYMEEAKKDFSRRIQELSYSVKAPKYALLSSVTRKIYNGDNFNPSEIETILSSQLIKQMNFIAQSGIASKYCYRFIEVGPKEVFSKMLGENIRDKQESILHVAEYLPKETSKKMMRGNEEILNITRRAVEKVTGHKATSLNLGDMFQEDLGIDSIKKAEILFNVLEETGKDFSQEMHYLQTSQFTSIGELVYALSKKTKKMAVIKEKFQIFSQVWQEVYTSDDAGQSLVPVIKDIKSFTGDPGFSKKIAVTINKDFKLETAEWVKLIEKIKNLEYGNCERKVLLVTNDNNSSVFNGLSSLLRSVRYEKPLIVKTVVLDSFKDKKLLKTIINREFGSREEAVLYKNGKRKIPVIKKIGGNKEKKKKPATNIVAIGGARGITRELLIKLSAFRDIKIAIIGRSEEASVEKDLRMLREKSKVEYFQADITKESDLERAFNKIGLAFGTIDLIIHSAGVQLSQELRGATKSDIENGLMAKVDGAKNAVIMAKKYNSELIAFSSIVSLYGNSGQSVYGAANSIMESYVSNYPKGRNILWPAWDGVGMMNNPVYIIKMKEKGMSLLSPKEAGNLFIKALESNQKRVVINTLGDHYRLVANSSKDKYLRATAERPVVFQKEYKLAENILFLDHSVKDTIYLPAAEMILLLQKVAEACFRTRTIIKNIKIENPIILKEDVVVSVGAKPFANMLEIQIKTIINHLRADVCPVMAKTREYKIEKTGKLFIQNPYAEGRLFHGPGFQVLGSITKSNNGSLVSDILPLKLKGKTVEKRLMLLIDSCFQLAGITSSVVSVPVGVKSILLTPENLEGDNYTVISKDGNAFVKNRGGKIVVDIIGIVMGVVK